MKFNMVMNEHNRDVENNWSETINSCSAAILLLQIYQDANR